MDLVFFEPENASSDVRQVLWVSSPADFEKIKKNPESKSRICIALSKTDDQLFSKIKNSGFLVAVESQTPSVAMWAVQRKADFLLVAVNTPKPAVDLAIANTAFQNEVALAVVLSEWWNVQRFRWSVLFKNAFWLAKIVRKSKAKGFVVSGAQNTWEQRNASNRRLLADWFGFGKRPE
ncbi:MAG: hypothetical protein V1777_03320 [Candidatus Micrarchaeota archaeon]